MVPWATWSRSVPGRDGHVPAAAPAAPCAWQRLCRGRACSAGGLPATGAAADASSDGFQASFRAKERLPHPAIWRVPSKTLPCCICRLGAGHLASGLILQWASSAGGS